MSQFAQLAVNSQPAPFCRLLVKAEVFADFGALQSRAHNPLSASQALFQSPQKSVKEQGTSPFAAPVVLNLLISLPFDARISALLRKVESDFKRKTHQQI